MILRCMSIAYSFHSNISETPCQVLLWFPQDSYDIRLLSILLTILVSGCHNKMAVTLYTHTIRCSLHFVRQLEQKHRAYALSFRET